ncbi:MAG: ATP-binding cassette domain-containing protein [Chloroflexi bacterium]|nr:MAG: ATP-binding cassette domain-containing protein [Chloroflexota bacterium]
MRDHRQAVQAHRGRGPGPPSARRGGEMSAAAVEAVGVERRFRGGRGVGPVSLRVETGESLALMGHNGAGKTTLLRMLATADRPLRGELRWNGDRSPGAARRSLGLALDRVDEEPSLTGRQAAHFWCRRWVGDRARARALVDAPTSRSRRTASGCAAGSASSRRSPTSPRSPSSTSPPPGWIPKASPPSATS